MDLKLGSALSRTNRALGVFRKASKELIKANRELVAVTEKSMTRIELERQRIGKAETTINANKKVLKNIENIIG